MYVCPPCHGQGLGRALFTAMADGLGARGYRSMKVWTLRGARATTFYAHLGGLRCDARARERAGGELVLQEVAYGFSLPPR